MREPASLHGLEVTTCDGPDESNSIPREASDRSRPDRVTGLDDIFRLGGLEVGRVCKLPVED